MPLLQRGELLERQRVDLAEHGQLALGGLEPLAAAAPGRRAPARPSWGTPSASATSTGTGWSGPYSATSASSVEAELLEGPLLELLQAHPLLGAGHLVAVDAG